MGVKSKCSDNVRMSGQLASMLVSDVINISDLYLGVPESCGAWLHPCIQFESRECNLTELRASRGMCEICCQTLQKIK